MALVIGAMITLEVIGRRRTSRVPAVGEWLGYLMRAWAGRPRILLG